jgi:hypothetical protein
MAEKKSEFKFKSFESKSFCHLITAYYFCTFSVLLYRVTNSSNRNMKNW